MFGTHSLLLFVLSGLLLNLSPGPDTLYITGRSTLQGWRAGVTAAIGVGAGCLIHTAAAVIGLSALLAASATAFTVVKIVGAGYLIYIGVGLMRAAGAGVHEARRRTLTQTSLRRVFVQGCLTNALNPKMALFFLAFLPQFVDPTASSKPLAFLFLGLVFDINGTLWNLAVAVFAARLAQGLRQSGGRLVTWFNRGVGAVLVYIGCRLAFIEPQ